MAPRTDTATFRPHLGRCAGPAEPPATGDISLVKGGVHAHPISIRARNHPQRVERQPPEQRAEVERRNEHTVELTAEIVGTLRVRTHDADAAWLGPGRRERRAVRTVGAFQNSK